MAVTVGQKQPTFMTLSPLSFEHAFAHTVPSLQGMVVVPSRPSRASIIRLDVLMWVITSLFSPLCRDAGLNLRVVTKRLPSTVLSVLVAFVTVTSASSTATSTRSQTPMPTSPSEAA